MYDINISSFIFRDSYEITLTPVIIAMSVSILRWYYEFSFNQIDILKFIDDFAFSEDWPFIQIINGNRTVKLGYMDKSPQITGKPSDVCIFHRYTFYRIDTTTCTGSVVSADTASVPGLDLIITRKTPYTKKYQFEFDFHVMLTIMAQMDDVNIIEHKELALTKTNILYCSLKIEVVHSILSYTGVEHHDVFDEFCAKMEAKYKNESPDLIHLFSLLGGNGIDPAKTHLALSYDIWYRAARENQRDWPEISTQPLNDRSVEFPKHSNVWYTPPNDKYIGLSLRQDDNVYRYIPRLYVRDHRLHNTYLRDYLDDIHDHDRFALPVTVRAVVKQYGSLYHTYTDYDDTTPALFLEHTGKVMMAHRDAMCIVYKNKVVGSIKDPSYRDQNTYPRYGDVQLLDHNWRRIKMLVDDEWTDDQGPRLLDIPAIPWYYRQIVHDYNKLGRLVNGPYMDLMHIGIVDPDGTDTITFPVTGELYVARTLETRRLMTFRFRPYTYENDITRVITEDES
jgi:hypothetical protein